MLFQQHVALISGAGSESGIGLAIARRLGCAGARVLLTASSTRVEQRVAELCAEGIQARGRAADLTDEQQVAELLDWAQAQWGQIDILVNNAGMAMQGSPEPFAELADMDLATWNLSIARNLGTAFLLTRAVLPGMRARGYGRIVNISSTTGTRGSNPGEAAYSAAKAGMLGLSMGLALEVAKQGRIRENERVEAKLALHGAAQPGDVAIHNGLVEPMQRFQPLGVRRAQIRVRLDHQIDGVAWHQSD